MNDKKQADLKWEKLFNTPLKKLLFTKIMMFLLLHKGRYLLNTM